METQSVGVLAVDRDANVSVPVTGKVSPGFEAVREAFIANFTQRDEVGAGFAVWRDDELLVDLAGGWTDRSQSEAFTQDTLVPVYSTSKGIAALVIAYIMEHHATADYETCVADVWPEFGAAGKEKVTIGQLMSHQAGLPGFAERVDRELWSDWRACAAKLASLPPLWPLGTGSGYHPTSWGYLVAELALRLSGRPFGEILREGFTNADQGQPDRESIDFHVGLDDKHHARCAPLIRPSSIADFGAITEATKAAFLKPWSRGNTPIPEWRRMEIPSSNGHGTAKSVARLYGIYAQEGFLGDQRILSADTFVGLTARRVSGIDHVTGHELQFAAGIVRNRHLVFGPNPNTLAHAGWGGSFGLGDPKLGISAGYVMNRQGATLQIDDRGASLIAALYTCLQPKRRRRRYNH